MEPREFVNELRNMFDEIERLMERDVEGLDPIIEQLYNSVMMLRDCYIDETLLTHLHKQLRLEIDKLTERCAEDV